MIDTRYRLVIIASQKQAADVRSKPQVETKAKPTTVALEEIRKQAGIFTGKEARQALKMHGLKRKR
jgi:DNA-directed RNA polymerase subunit K/omega